MGNENENGQNRKALALAGVLASPDRARFDPRYVVKANASPLQSPVTDERLLTEIVAGPDQPGDRRLFLSASTLEALLAMARASPMGRVVLFDVGVRIDTYRSPATGHTYEAWQIVGTGPAPEPLPSVIRSAPK